MSAAGVLSRVTEEWRVKRLIILRVMPCGQLGKPARSAVAIAGLTVNHSSGDPSDGINQALAGGSNLFSKTSRSSGARGAAGRRRRAWSRSAVPTADEEKFLPAGRTALCLKASPSGKDKLLRWYLTKGPPEAQMGP
jgi:hypothetical protein